MYTEVPKSMPETKGVFYTAKCLHLQCMSMTQICDIFIILLMAQISVSHVVQANLNREL
jgi:hypothetical protein